jgi:hypothetical protein
MTVVLNAAPQRFAVKFDLAAGAAASYTDHAEALHILRYRECGIRLQAPLFRCGPLQPNKGSRLRRPT